MDFRVHASQLEPGARAWAGVGLCFGAFTLGAPKPTNRGGMSYGALKKTAKKERRKVTELIALAPNNDPFYIGELRHSSKQQSGSRTYGAASVWSGHAPETDSL